jgi:hypothetical protein
VSEKVDKLKATAIAYNPEFLSVSATIDQGGGRPKPITVTLTPEGFSQMLLMKVDVKDELFHGNRVFTNEHTVVFWNARYTGADEHGGVYYYDADYMFFI